MVLIFGGSQSLRVYMKPNYRVTTSNYTSLDEGLICNIKCKVSFKTQAISCLLRLTPPAIPETLTFGSPRTHPSAHWITHIPDHDGDSRPAPARLPLHRPESHREGSDPLNGAPRPEP
ncbi:unnamed protein product [Pieris brassicae]|uniref:Uncharacterized protein n=1 Tax=Pieris brassicae TaxID=7116 RepID=A0A9P0TPZ6_PIEBR|nr:unnamed protein product [Pieris brassicae]